MVQVWTLDGKFALFWKLGKPNLPVSFEYTINLDFTGDFECLPGKGNIASFLYFE